MAKDSEKSDDELLNTLGARAGSYVCRQRFGLGKNKKVCTKPKGHKGPHKQ